MLILRLLLNTIMATFKKRLINDIIFITAFKQNGVIRICYRNGPYITGLDEFAEELDRIFTFDNADQYIQFGIRKNKIVLFYRVDPTNVDNPNLPTVMRVFGLWRKRSVVSEMELLYRTLNLETDTLLMSPDVMTIRMIHKTRATLSAVFESWGGTYDAEQGVAVLNRDQVCAKRKQG